jgi:hypothetical protein
MILQEKLHALTGACTAMIRARENRDDPFIAVERQMKIDENALEPVRHLRNGEGSDCCPTFKTTRQQSRSSTRLTCSNALPSGWAVRSPTTEETAGSSATGYPRDVAKSRFGDTYLTRDRDCTEKFS